MRFTATLVAASAIGGALAQSSPYLGFNSGASDDSGKAKDQAAFEKEFKAAQNLEGAPGSFNTVRLYSNIQWGTTNTPIAAFPAAISTKTKLLLGIWTSGTTSIDGELSALEAAIKQYGSKLTDLVVGISVGSEDLYRVSESGIKNKSGPGNSAENLVKFIKQTRDRLSKTALKDIKVTHVDTWTAWDNDTNKAVIDAIDFVGVNAFPFYEAERDNKIDNAALLFSSALSKTESRAGNKEVWITETGWAYTGEGNWGNAKATEQNAGTYWKEVGCAIFGKKNVFWYTLRDSNPDNKVKFAITNDLSTKARFDLSCPQGKTLPSVNSSNSNVTSTNSTNSTTTSKPTSTNSPTTNTNTQSNGNSNSNTNSKPQTQNGNAGSMTSVSVTIVLSAVFAAAAWAL